MRFINQLSALAHPHRLRVFRYLVANGDTKTPVGQIGMSLNITASSLSGYLSTLEQSGLLLSERESRFIHYRINASAVRELMDYLVSDCCNANPELCGMATATPLPAVNAAGQT